MIHYIKDRTVFIMDELIDCMESSCSLYESYNQGIIGYIKQLNIPYETRERLLYLVENDSYNDYMEIYNICVENGVELPPI